MIKFENYNVLALVMLALSMFCGIVYIITKLIKSEKSRKDFGKSMKVGDSAYTPTASNGVIGEIVEINNEEVKILITVPKSRVYPA